MLSKFFKEDEIKNDEGVVFTMDGITLSQLEAELLKRYSKVLSLQEQDLLQRDYEVSSYPTPLQFQISNMFGKDLEKLLENLKCDYDERCGKWMEKRL